MAADSSMERAVFTGLLTTVRDLVMPGTTEEEMTEVAGYIVTTIRSAIRHGGSDSLLTSKAAIESYLGVILSEKQMRSFIESCNKLTDKFVILSVNDGTQGKQSHAMQLMEESSSDSSSSSDDDTSSEESDEEAAGAATKKRRTEAGAVSKFAANADVEDEEAVGSAVDKVQFRQIGQFYIRDARLKRLFLSDTTEELDKRAYRILKILSNTEEDSTVKTQLTSCFGNDDEVEVNEEVDFLVENRWTLVYGTQASIAVANAAIGTSDEAKSNEAVRKARGLVMDRMKSHAMSDPRVASAYQSATGVIVNEHARLSGYHALDLIDLESLCRSGEKAGIIPSQLRPVVPKGTRRGDFESHEEIILPQCETYSNSKHGKDHKELDIMKAFPQWITKGFDIAKTKSLNPMQSIVHPVAFRSDDNMLVSAPTGAGKTLVALMTILRVLDNYKTDHLGSDFYKNDFKIVYIAPMKALVQEVVQTFSARLEPFGIEVAELSGDSGLSQQQLAQTQMIVATPEKWDIVTRKSTEMSVANTVRLIIIDEVHLLHNDRGPILESIVARTILQQERTHTSVRLVGLSATLPNANDVSKFLKVDKMKGFFNFDASYRPVPLQQTYCAVKKIPGKMHAEVLNSVTYTKTLGFEGQSVMIFVHSRKDTEFTANYIMQRAMKENQLSRFGVKTAENRQFIEEEGADLRESLKELIPHGFGVHHAGMSAFERNAVEKLFMDKKIRVLVCTSTLAWGVNLPTHAVIIKGTQIYSPQQKGTTYLSSLDVLQMFGRAGRKGFDSFGEACIITTAEDVQYYLCILNHQLDIESQFVNHLPDGLNAEIVLGNVSSIADGAAWLQHTYHYIRTLKCPKKYGTTILKSDPHIEAFRANLIHSAAMKLAECQMVEYNERDRTLKPTPLGRIASTYYIHYKSMKIYNEMLKSTSQEIDLFHIFSRSSEFAQISVRRAEQEEVKKLIEVCPIPIKDGYNYTSPEAKINVLLQCYITGANLKGMELMTEMVYIKDSAQRLLKALYDMCVVRDFGITSRKVHQIYQNVLRHQWSVLCPLRQLVPAIKASVSTHGVRAAAVKGQLAELGALISEVERRKDMDYHHYRQYNYDTMLNQVFDKNEAKTRAFYSFVKKVPRLLVEASTRPISNTVLQMDIEIKLDIEYDPIVHDGVSSEMIISVEDATLHSNSAMGGVSGGPKWATSAANTTKCILYHEVMDASKLIRNGAALRNGETSEAADDGTNTAFDAEVEEENSDGRPSINTTILVPVSATNRPIYYFVHVMLSSWVGCSTIVPVPLVSIAMPPPPPPPTSLEAFSAHLHGQREQAREARQEQRRRENLELELQGRNTLDEVQDDEYLSSDVSISDLVGESLAGVAGLIFPFETISMQQAVAAQAVLSTTGTDGRHGEGVWGGNVYVGMPAGTGKTFLAELTILRLLMENNLSGDESDNAANASSNFNHLLYLTVTAAQAERRYIEWNSKFGTNLGQSVILLTGNTSNDLAALKSAMSPSSVAGEGLPLRTVIVIACAAHISSLVQRGSPVLRCVRYLVADHLHQLGTVAGGTYEAVVSRLMAKPYLLNKGAEAARVVGLSYPVVYPQALADWLKVKKPHVFSFDNASMRRLKVTVEGSLIPGARSRAEQQSRVALREIVNQIDMSSAKQRFANKQVNAASEGSSTIVFAPSAPDALKLARQLIELRKQKQRMQNKESQAAHTDSDKANTVVKVVGGTGELSSSEALIDKLQNDNLRTMCQKSNVLLLTGTTSTEDFKTILRIVALNELPLVIFSTRDDAWRFPAALFTNSVILASEKLPVSASDSVSAVASQQQAFDCTAVDMVQMASRADKSCTVYCRQPRKWYWENFLCGPALMAVTSVLSTPEDYEAAFNSRIAEGSVGTLSQALSIFQSHYFYQLLKVNPALFGLPNSDKATLTAMLSKVCDATCASLRDAGCILYREENGTVATTSVGSAAAQLCVSVDSVRTLLEIAGPLLEEAKASTGGDSTNDNAKSSSAKQGGVASIDDVVIRALIQLVCSLGEITSLPCAAVSSGAERHLLLRIAQDLPILHQIRTDLTCTTAADKAFVLVMMTLHKVSYDFGKSLSLYGRGGSDTVDEDLLVVAAQLVRDSDEIAARAEHITMAAVDIVGRRSFTTARAFIDANASLLIRSLPSEVLKSGGLAQVSDKALPSSVLKQWFAAVAGGTSSPTLESITSDSCTKATNELAAVFQATLFGHSALTMDEASVSGRQQIVVAAVSEAKNQARLAAHIQTLFSGSSATVRINLTAAASVVEVHEVLHLSVDIRFDNFLSGHAASEAFFWAVCYDDNKLTGPAFGIKLIRVCDSANPIESKMVVPLPAESDNTEDVVLKLALIPQSLYLIGSANPLNSVVRSGITTTIEIVEGEE